MLPSRNNSCSSQHIFDEEKITFKYCKDKEEGRGGGAARNDRWQL